MIRRLPSNALQAAIYETLTTSKYLDTPIYDNVDENAELPYIIFGDGNCAADGAKDSDITNTTLHIEIYSKQRGFKEINDIADTILYIFTTTDFQVEGFKVISKDIPDFIYGRTDDGDYFGSIVLNIKLQYAGEYEGE